jgi:hypothetical protein
MKTNAFDLPIFGALPVEHRAANLSREAIMRETELVRRECLNHCDTLKSLRAALPSLNSQLSTINLN